MPKAKLCISSCSLWSVQPIILVLINEAEVFIVRFTTHTVITFHLDRYSYSTSPLHCNTNCVQRCSLAFNCRINGAIRRAEKLATGPTPKLCFPLSLTSNFNATQKIQNEILISMCKGLLLRPLENGRENKKKKQKSPTIGGVTPPHPTPAQPLEMGKQKKTPPPPTCTAEGNIPPLASPPGR